MDLYLVTEYGPVNAIVFYRSYPDKPASPRPYAALIRDYVPGESPAERYELFTLEEAVALKDYLDRTADPPAVITTIDKIALPVGFIFSFDELGSADPHQLICTLFKRDDYDLPFRVTGVLREYNALDEEIGAGYEKLMADIAADRLTQEQIDARFAELEAMGDRAHAAISESENGWGAEEGTFAG
jgi:hypothetical protein